LVVKMEEYDAPPPAFKPGDYFDNAELERLLSQLGMDARLEPGDFVDERHLDTVVGGGGEADRHGGAGQGLHRPRQRRRVTKLPTRRRQVTGLL
jgi:hypothetical protein